MVPGRLIAAGPGRPAEPSTSTLPLDGTQKVDASVAGCGLAAASAPFGAMPVSVKERQFVLPKQPAVVWPGQNRPAGFDLELVPVVTGLRFALTVPRSMLPSVPPGAQSFESPCEFVVVHDRPARAPRSHVPVPGALGVPVAEHFGQGCVGLPVT